ncbi:MAG: hypothetical protein GY861_18125 [bacterium]|nr:hypothetical protein [bacterium]
MIEVMICEKCQAIYPVDIDGEHCGIQECNGYLIRITISEEEYNFLNMRTEIQFKATAKKNGKHAI